MHYGTFVTFICRGGNRFKYQLSRPPHSLPIHSKFTNLTLIRSFSNQSSQNGSIIPKYLIPMSVIIGGGISYLLFYSQKKTVKAFCHDESALSASSKPSVNREDTVSLDDAIMKSADLLKRLKDEVGSPGLLVAASINGKEVWNTGFGYADVENRIKCNENTVMRIASISKSIAMTVVAKLWEMGKLDIDKPVSEYIPNWPLQTFANEKVDVTTRHVVSHLGGIRHYAKDCGKNETNKAEETDEQTEKAKVKKSKKEKKKPKKTEYEHQEYYIKHKYDSVCSSLSLFKDDPLCSKPGTEFLYTTHGYTVVSAVAEAAAGKPFEQLSNELFRSLGMHHTYLDENEPIIYGRSRYYIKDKDGRLKNAQYVDNSYKWAGGGYISTAGDLIKFANIMLYSFQQDNQNSDKNDKGKILPGYLKASTMKSLWSPVDKTKCSWDKDGGSYGMGWGVMPKIAKFGQAMERPYYVSHTGGAIGASSVLLVLPNGDERKVGNKKPPPHGISVAIIINMQGVNLNPVALDIAKLFAKVDADEL